MDTFFLKSTLFVYLLSTLGYFVSLSIKRVLVAKISTWIFFAAFLLHTFFFAIRFIDTGYTPVISGYGTFSLFAWAIAGVYLAFQPKTKTRVLGAFVAPVTLLLMVIASAGMDEYVSLPDALKSNLVPVHIVLSVTGEALFVLASCAGVVYLIQENLIKNKRVGKFSKILPSLNELDRINHFCLLWGFPLLTLGVLIGSLWARTVWGSHWHWDPKQIWTLLAWFSYAFLLHQRLAIGWKGHKAAFFSILALAILLISLIVMNTFFVTAHSFI